MKWWHLMNTLWVSLILTSLLVLFVQDPFMTNYGIDPMAKFAYLALIGILAIGLYGVQSVWKHQLMKVSMTKISGDPSVGPFCF
ncbi:hypothetical protein ODV97_02020 [Enterococcus gallinarum]|nr:hypothetical protein [Enterococcus gallinarum]